MCVPWIVCAFHALSVLSPWQIVQTLIQFSYSDCSICHSVVGYTDSHSNSEIQKLGFKAYRLQVKWCIRSEITSLPVSACSSSSAVMSLKNLTLWMLGSFLKIDYIVVCFLKPLNSDCFFMGNERLSSKQVGSQSYSAAGLDPTCLHKHKCGSRTERVKAPCALKQARDEIKQTSKLWPCWLFICGRSRVLPRCLIEPSRTVGVFIYIKLCLTKHMKYC